VTGTRDSFDTADVSTYSEPVTGTRGPAAPGQAQAVDPHSIAYRVHAHAFNKLSEYLCTDQRFIPLSVRDAIASAVVEAVEPLIREDERATAAQPQTAPGDVGYLGSDALAKRYGDALQRIVDVVTDMDAVDKLARNALGLTRVGKPSSRVKPAPEVAAAAPPLGTAWRLLNETRAERDGYRDALQQVAKHTDSEHAQLRIVARIAKRALEGK